MKTVHPATKASAIWLLIVFILCLICSTCILQQRSHANSDHSAALLEAVYSMSFKYKEIPQIHCPPTLNCDCDGLCVLNTPPNQPACRYLLPLQDKRHFWISNDLTLDQTSISSSSSSSLNSQRELFNFSAAEVTLQDQILHVSNYTWQCPERVISIGDHQSVSQVLYCGHWKGKNKCINIFDTFKFLFNVTKLKITEFYTKYSVICFLLEPKNDCYSFYTG